MCNSQFVSQPSWDLDIYLPSELDFEETLFYQSPEMLIHSINFDMPPLAHRIESNLFDPITDDVEASLALTDDELSLINIDISDITNYFYEQSTVVPHIPNLSNQSKMNINSPLSPSPSVKSNISQPNSPVYSNQFNIKKFLVFDELTGRERRPLLHEFIRLILENDQYLHIAEYTDRKQGIFKLHKPKDIAELWKHVKGRNSDNSKLNLTTKNFCSLKIFFY
jgi:hypothetical protein